MMLQRFKSWLIKKLGGYTKAEYDDWSRRPVERFEFIPHPENRIVTLQTEGRYDYYFGSPPRDWIEERLIGELAKQLKPYVLFQECVDRCNMKNTVRAYVKVVDGDV